MNLRDNIKENQQSSTVKLLRKISYRKRKLYLLTMINKNYIQLLQTTWLSLFVLVWLEENDGGTFFETRYHVAKAAAEVPIPPLYLSSVRAFMMFLNMYYIQ